MKRLLALLLVVCLFLPCAALAELSEDVKTLMVETTEELTAVMLEKGRSAAYLKWFGVDGADPALQSRINEIVSSDWNTVSGGTIYVLKEGAVDAILSVWDMRLNDFPRVVVGAARREAANMLADIVINHYCVSVQDERLMDAAKVMISETAIAVDETFPELSIALLHSAHDYDTICTFIRTGDAAFAVAMPIPTGREEILKQAMGKSFLTLNTSRLYEEYAVE